MRVPICCTSTFLLGWMTGCHLLMQCTVRMSFITQICLRIRHLWKERTDQNDTSKHQLTDCCEGSRPVRTSYVVCELASSRRQRCRRSFQLADLVLSCRGHPSIPRVCCLQGGFLLFGRMSWVGYRHALYIFSKNAPCAKVGHSAHIHAFSYTVRSVRLSAFDYQRA